MAVFRVEKSQNYTVMSNYHLRDKELSLKAKGLLSQMLNLTRRQLICFGSGILIGVPLFFLVKSRSSISAASICMILIMLPFFLLAMYEKNGLPLEKIIRNIARVYFLRPKQRPYETNNFYAVLERQEKLDKEVNEIVHKEKAHPRRQKAD